MSRLIIFGLVVAVFILLVRALFPSSNRKEAADATKEMVKDPNCETYVPQSEALQKTVRGEDYFFCSEKCAEEYSQKNS
jgi:uncharacterized protein